MKSYTDLEQSKKLVEFLPLESADMRFCFSHTLSGRIIGHYPMIGREPSLGTTPCWSLAALFNLCPTINGKQPILTRGKITRLWYCYYEDEMDTQTYDNSVDAVFEMIQLLHEQKLL